MKTTKILFSMMCTAALFAACSSEEFEQEGGATLNRKTLNVTLTAENIAGTSAETRLGAEISGGQMHYSWTEDDRLGAALLDGSLEGTYDVGNNVSVNYPFDFTTGAENAANFSAKTPIMAGTYMFYYQYKPQTNRGPLTLAVEAQQNYVASEGTPENQMAKYYVGVSPRLTLAEGISMEGDATGLTLPLKFQKLNAAIKLAVTPKDLPAGTKINKIELKRYDGTAITLGGEYRIPSTAISGDAIDVEDNDELADDIAEAVENIVATNVTDNSVSKNTIAVSMYADADKKAAGERGIELTNGTAFNAYIVVPVNTIAADYIVAIYTSEGKLEYVVENAKFEVNKVYASAFAFDLKKADMNKYESFDVASTTDWDEAISYVNSHTSEYLGEPVNFNISKGEIYVASLPTFPITLTSQDAQATMILGKKSKAATTINIDKNITVNSNSLSFVIGKGATVNYNNAITTSQTVTFENNGTFNVAVDATQAITNKGTMTLSVAQTAAVLTNAKSARITFNGGSSKNITYKATTLKNNGNITVEQKAILDAPLTTATFDTYDPMAVITVNGEWKNASAGVDNQADTKVVVSSTGVLNLKSNVAGAEIEVSGKLSAVSGASNAGTITLKSGAKGNKETITNTGKIVIEDYANYSANQDSSTLQFKINNTSGITTVNVSNKSQYDGVTTDTNINDITLNGGNWTIGGGSTHISVTGSNGLTLKNATVTLAQSQTISNSLNVSGTSSISGATFTLAASKLNVEANAALTIAKNTTVTVEGSSTADPSTTEVTILGSLTNNGKLKGAVGKEFIDIQVGKAVRSGKHAASLTNGSTGFIAETGKQATVNNFGTVTLHQSGKAYVKVTNQKNAVLNGNPM